MNDIYELKAQKYKLKYEKLLQELEGGTGTLQQISNFEYIKNNNNNINKKLVELKQKLYIQNENLKFFQEDLEKLLKRHSNINSEIQKIEQTQNYEIVRKLMIEQNLLSNKIDSIFDIFESTYKNVKY